VEAFDELRALYAATDALLGTYSCDQSTDCCQFGVTGREPYVTEIEAAFLRSALSKGSAAARPASSARRGLPLAHRPCPVLGLDGRCRAYQHRPFGCRTFFCDRVRPSHLAPELNEPGRKSAKNHPDRVYRKQLIAWGRELAGISARAFEGADSAPSREWIGGPRPLTRVLESGLARAPKSRAANTMLSKR
jgi:Fe-S-cluster containining protein